MPEAKTSYSLNKMYQNEIIKLILYIFKNKIHNYYIFFFLIYNVRGMRNDKCS